MLFKKPLIGIDLDGVIAIENNEKYLQAKYHDDEVKRVTWLYEYYHYLPPNKYLIDKLIENKDKYDFRIYTARRSDYKTIVDDTRKWLDKVRLDFVPVTHTRFAWKAPELLRDRVDVMIDNNWRMLRWVPFIPKLVYLQDSEAIADYLCEAPERLDKKFERVYTHMTNIRNTNLLFEDLKRICYNR